MAQNFTELLDQCIPESAKKRDREIALDRYRRLQRVLDSVVYELANLESEYDFGGERVRRG